MNIQWNADKYTSDFSFVHEYGSGVMDLIDSGKAQSVLDLGCGNGALSKALSDRGFAVTGLDASEDLLRIARAAYPDIPFIRADATDFSLTEQVDAVFSNAVLHWIDGDKQPDLLRCVYNALNDGGQFVFEFGGLGNNRLIHAALSEQFEKYGYVYQMPFYFPTIGEYAALLEQAGFRVTYAILFDRPTRLQGQNGMADWIEMFVKTPFETIPDKALQTDIITEAARRLRGDLFQDGIWYADYVRLRMKALKVSI